MKKLLKNLISISETLSILAVRVEKIADVFEAESLQAKPAKKTAAKKRAVPKKVKKKAAPKKKVAAKKKETPVEAEPTKEVSEQESEPEGGIIDNILGLISSGGEGTTVSELKEKTGFAPRQVSNALFKLKQGGKIESLSRGVYVKKE